LPVVLIEDLYYAYPPLVARQERPALQRLNLRVEQGEFVAVAGRSGAGKSTLCLALCGVVPHSTGGTFGGRVVVCGHDTRRHGPAELSAFVGVVFQDPESQLFAPTVEDEVAFGLECQGLPPNVIAERVSWALSKVGLSEHRLRNPSYLSGGQKQRVAIAAAIALQPRLLVLDEPTASLDPVGTQEVVQVLASLRADQDTAVVMVTQEAELIAEFANRLVILSEGQVVYDGSPEDALLEPEFLWQHGVRPPAIGQLAAALRRRGIPARFVTLAQASQFLRLHLAAEGKACPL
jgi:energy-coupling factor transporter ATP-binding protein EcfA2